MACRRLWVLARHPPEKNNHRPTCGFLEGLGFRVSTGFSALDTVLAGALYGSQMGSIRFTTRSWTVPNAALCGPNVFGPSAASDQLVLKAALHYTYLDIYIYIYTHAHIKRGCMEMNLSTAKPKRL